MRATSGNLRIDQGYKLKDCEYHGKFMEGGVAETCQNCGLIITNVAVVEGQSDRILYRIGLDCASTLTSIAPSEIAEAKKKLARRAKFLKFLKTEAKSIVVRPSGCAWVYTTVVEEWESSWKYRTDADYNMATFRASGLPILFDTE